MTAEVDEEMQEEIFTSIGGRFQTARKAAELSVDEAAAKLYVEPYFIEALELEDYSVFESRVFALGYIRKYAILLNLDEKSMVNSAKLLLPDAVRDGPTLKKPPEHHFAPSARRKGQGVNIAGTLVWILLLLVIVTVGVLWWIGFLPLPGIQDNRVANENESATQPAPQTIELDAADSSLTIPDLVAIPEEVPAAIEVPVVETGLSDEPETSDETPAEVLDIQDESELTPEELSAIPVEGAVDEAPQIPAEAELTLNFSERCWVNIRDMENARILVGNFAAGTTQRVQMTEPLSLQFGRADAVTMLVDGEPFDLEPYTKDNIIRMKLDLAEIARISGQ